MGGRKFKLGRVRKDAKRKRHRPSIWWFPFLAICCTFRFVQNLNSLCALRNITQNHPSISTIIHPISVTLPIPANINGPVSSLQSLTSCLSMLSLSLPWVITSHISLILCKIETLNDQHPTIAVSLTIEAKLQWTATVAMKIYPCTCTSLFHLPHPIQAVEDIYCVMRFFSTAKVCGVGNPDGRSELEW